MESQTEDLYDVIMRKFKLDFSFPSEPSLTNIPNPILRFFDGISLNYRITYPFHVIIKEDSIAKYAIRFYWDLFK